MPKISGHKWQFNTRFRRHAFGWKSQPAIMRVREAVSEIKRIARTEPICAADGAVSFLERISPALENVDSSSGAIGTAVNRAIAELVPIIAAAPVDASTRAAWLERLFAAARYDELIDLVQSDVVWPYKRWAVKAYARSLVALPEPVIVNCSGLGARAPFNDLELYPGKGQLLVLPPQPEVDFIVDIAGDMVSSKDLEAIQKRALAEGLPYQTLIASLLHKYAAGRLKEV